jgi:hypothetical protein
LDHSGHKEIGEVGLKKLKEIFGDEVELKSFEVGNWVIDMSQMVDQRFYNTIAEFLGKKPSQAASFLFEVIESFKDYLMNAIYSVLNKDFKTLQKRLLSLAEEMKIVEQDSEIYNLIANPRIADYYNEMRNDLKDFLTQVIETGLDEIREIIRNLFELFDLKDHKRCIIFYLAKFLTMAVGFHTFILPENSKLFSFPFGNKKSISDAEIKNMQLGYRMDPNVFVTLIDLMFTEYLPLYHMDRPPKKNEDNNYQTKIKSDKKMYVYLHENIEYISGIFSEIDERWRELLFLSNQEKIDGKPNYKKYYKEWNLLFARLGHSIHIAEDFYAHSTFIDTAFHIGIEKEKEEKAKGIKEEDGSYFHKKYLELEKKEKDRILLENHDVFLKKRLIKWEKGAENRHRKEWPSFSPTMDEYLYEIILNSGIMKEENSEFTLEKDDNLVTGFSDTLDTVISLLLKLDKFLDLPYRNVGYNIKRFNLLFQFDMMEYLLLTNKSHDGNQFKNWIVETEKYCGTVKGLENKWKKIKKIFDEIEKADNPADKTKTLNKLFCCKENSGKQREISEDTVKKVNETFKNIGIGYKLIREIINLCETIYKLVDTIWSLFDPKKKAKAIWAIIKEGIKPLGHILLAELRGALLHFLGANRIGCHSLMNKDTKRQLLFEAAMNCAKSMHCEVITHLLRHHNGPESIRTTAGSGNIKNNIIYYDWLELFEYFMKHPLPEKSNTLLKDTWWYTSILNGYETSKEKYKKKSYKETNHTGGKKEDQKYFYDHYFKDYNREKYENKKTKKASQKEDFYQQEIIYKSYTLYKKWREEYIIDKKNKKVGKGGKNNIIKEKNDFTFFQLSIDYDSAVSGDYLDYLEAHKYVAKHRGPFAGKAGPAFFSFRLMTNAEIKKKEHISISFRINKKMNWMRLKSKDIVEIDSYQPDIRYYYLFFMGYKLRYNLETRTSLNKLNGQQVYWFCKFLFSKYLELKHPKYEKKLMDKNARPSVHTNNEGKWADDNFRRIICHYSTKDQKLFEKGDTIPDKGEKIWVHYKLTIKGQILSKYKKEEDQDTRIVSKLICHTYTKAEKEILKNNKDAIKNKEKTIYECLYGKPYDPPKHSSSS